MTCSSYTCLKSISKAESDSQIYFRHSIEFPTESTENINTHFQFIFDRSAFRLKSFQVLSDLIGSNSQVLFIYLFFGLILNHLIGCVTV